MVQTKYIVRPGPAGLLIGIECYRVRDSSWIYLTSFCNYPNRRRTSCSTRKLPDRVVVGLQLYSARTFHVILSPRIYKGGHGPPQNNHLHLRQYKPPHKTYGITQLAARTSLNLRVPCTIEFQSRRSLPTNPTAKGIPEQAWR